MATFSIKDIQLLFVGGAAAKSTGGVDTLNQGEIGLFTPGGTRLTEATAATADSFMMVLDNGTEPNIVSGIIKKADIKSATRTLYSATVQKVEYIGWNGTSGSISVANDTDYHVRLTLRQTYTSNHGGHYVKHGWYTSDSSATQEEIAAGLHLSLVNDFIRETDKVIRFERVNSGAGAALGGGPATLSVRNGGTIIVASAAGHGLVAGDRVRIGTAVTDPVYVVTAVSGVNITIDVPYQGPTASGLAGENVAAGGSWGIQMTGQSQAFVLGKIHNDVIDWHTSLEGFGSTILTVSSAWDPGNGTERQIQELEFFTQMFEGDPYTVGEPNLFPRRTLASGNYDIIHISIEQLYKDSIVTGPIKKLYTLAIPQTTPAYADGATADDITDVLEVLVFGSATGTLAV